MPRTIIRKKKPLAEVTLTPKPQAIICDLDGTLCKMVDRGPYDEDKVSTDEVHLPIKTIIEKFTDTHVIIFVSGRSTKCMQDTVDWIHKNVKVLPCPTDRIPQLYMRQAGDVRKDSIVKQEIYDNLIKHEYDVLFVLDDRDQVVQMWRENGLTCLQVAPGNF